MKTLVQVFKTLAEIDSVSGDEKKISDFIVKYLKDLGLGPVQDKFNNIYVRVGDQPNPKLLCAHMDTVEPGRGVKVIEENGILKSDGSTIIGGDNKASVALILYTLTKLLNENKPINVELLFTVREETDSGVSQFNTDILQSKLAFVFDGGNGSLGWLAKSAPTIQDFKIKITGKSAHASLPEDGKNVLEFLFDLKGKLKLGRPDEYTTLNIGIASAGIATNSVPGILTLEGDLRSSKSENFEKHKREFEEIITKIALDHSMKIDFRWIPYAYGYEMDLSTPNYNNVRELYKDFGINIEPTDVKGGSDAAFLNYKGIESYCLGDSVIDVHTVNERIEIKNYELLQQIVESIFLKVF